MNHRIIRLFSLCFVVIILTCYDVSAAMLDPEFGNDGRVAVELGIYGDRATAVVVQPDGKIVVAGSSSSASNLNFMIFRLLEDGSLDPDFNYDGTVTFSIGFFDDEILTLALQDDGKIVAAGYSSNGTDRDFAMVRYNSDGSLDRNFGMEGMVVTSVGNSDDEITGLALQDDGAIVVTGSTLGTAGRVVVLGRYLADGSLDTGFGDDGFSFTGVGKEAQAESVALLENKGIVVAGSYGDGDKTGLMIVGFSFDGQLDAGFGDNGIAVPADSRIFSEGYGMFIRSNGTILVAGSVGEEGKRDAALFQFTASGDPDPDFEENGVLVTAVSVEDDVLYDVVATDNHIAASGYTTAGNSREFLFITYQDSRVTVQQTPASEVESQTLADGSSLRITELQVEESFDEYQEAREPAELLSNVVTTEFGDGDDVATALAVVPSSGMVVVGVTAQSETTNAAVSKYTVATTQNSTATTSSKDNNVLILTGEPFDVTRTTAIIPVEILSGLGSVTQRGVVFGTMPNPVLLDDGDDGDGGDGGDDTTAPVIINTTGGSFTTSETVTLSITTDEDATCKYNKDSDPAYASMTNTFAGADSTIHTADLSTLKAASYTYYARCVDAAGNENPSGTKVTFLVSVDGGGTAGPTIDDVFFDDEEPADGANGTATLVVTTNEKATCKFSTKDVDYGSMNEFETTGGLKHSVGQKDLESDQDYTYYIRCQDTARNESVESRTLTFNDEGGGSINKTLQIVGNLFVTTAIAAESSDDTNEDNDNSNGFDANNDDFIEEGSTKVGSGTGAFSSKLEHLKPGTFFYMRAYAIVGGTVYYGNQVGARTADSCFIATAAFGSIFHPSVRLLREFRDTYMLNNHLGRSLVTLYYHYSPSVADVIATDSTLRFFIRILLLPLVGAAWLAIQLGVIGLLLLTAVAGLCGYMMMWPGIIYRRV